jgi:hypothetical protein
MGEREEIRIRDIYSLPWQLWRRACRVPARDTKFKQQRQQCNGFNVVGPSTMSRKQL